MRLADVDPLSREPVMFQEPPIAGLELPLGRKVVDRRAQAVAAMPSRHSPQFPQRVLQAVGQRFERLRRADTYRLPVRVGEDEVIRQMLESLSEDGDSQGVHVGEIRGRQVTGVVHLAKHDRASQTTRSPPLLDAPLKRAAVALGQLPGRLSLEPLEQRLRPQPGLRFQPCLGPRPQFRERVLPRSIRPRPLLGAGERTQRAIFACRLFVHSSPPGRHRQPRLRFQISK